MKLFPTKPKSSPSAARQRLQAAVARRGARAPSIEEEEEPTTSFKTALVVMVLLHVAFFGGVYMFESVKMHHPASFEAPAASAKAKTSPAPKPAIATTAQSGAAALPAAAPRVKPQPLVADPAKKTAPAATPAAPMEAKDSGVLYTIAKGDTPVTIAKKLHVGYDDLLKLNKIDDPKKLRIGQKLHIPVKPRTSAN